MNDSLYDDFETLIRMMFGSYGRKCLDDHVRGYWSVLRAEPLIDVRRAIDHIDHDGASPPTARKLAKWIGSRSQASDRGDRIETRPVHYQLTNDACCRRCGRPTEAMTPNETCPPEGYRLRPSDVEAGDDWATEMRCRDSALRGELEPISHEWEPV